MNNETVTITCSKEVLDLINLSVEFYAGIGAGDFSQIIEHPTFKNLLKVASITDNKIDYDYLYSLIGEIKYYLIKARDIVSEKDWGLYSEKIHKSCIEAYHIHEYINYELSKLDNIRPTYLTREYSLPYEPAICKNRNINIPIFSFKIENNGKSE